MQDDIIRPNGFEKEKRDCTVRALSLVSNIPYNTVHNTFKDNGRRNGRGVIAKKIIQKVANALNIELKQIKRSGSLNKLIQEYPKGNLFCLRRGHAFAVIDGVSHDESNLKRHIQGAWLLVSKETSNNRS